MRVKDSDFEKKLKESLRQRPKLSEKSEASVFAQAEALLASRRLGLAAREAETIRVVQARANVVTRLKSRLTDAVELLAIYPDAPAAVMTVAVLLLAFLAIHRSHAHFSSPDDSQSQDLPKNNDVPARYDAQRMVEQSAYEREVEDAHQRTSGGI